MQKQKVVVVAGPTASGKTKLGIHLAKEFNGEIISADSMQIYKGFSVLSAKPTAEEQEGIPHHLIDFLPVTHTFSVADFVSLARQKIEEISKRNKLPMIVGGTGLYIDALLNNFDFEEGDRDDQIRQNLLQEAQKSENPKEYLFSLLQQKDPEYAKRVHPNNEVRVIRALEVMAQTGMTMTQYQEKVIQKEQKYESLKIYLTFSDREKLYNRINTRVDNMVGAGLIDEAKQVYESSEINQTAKAAIGYKELIPFFEGQASLDDALELLKQNTRRYAKRQLTWFRKDTTANWLYIDELGEKNLLLKAQELTKQFLHKD